VIEKAAEAHARLEAGEEVAGPREDIVAGGHHPRRLPDAVCGIHIGDGARPFLADAASIGDRRAAEPDACECHGSGSCTVLPRSGGIDLAGAQRAVADLLRSLGLDPDGDDLRETPRRVARAYADLLSPKAFSFTTFPNDEGYDELIVARHIRFHSVCMHHLLPFVGVAHVGYVPGDRILGLSKLARVVELFARGLQVQERLTVQIGRWLQEHLGPRGVGVVIDAEHMCMSLRGVEKPGARTLTSSLWGCVRDDPRTRQEFLTLVGAPTPSSAASSAPPSAPVDG
jgi:GTP cyclohydrolase IA